MKRIGTVSLFVLALSVGMSGISFADSAEVLPKGVSRVSLDTKFYLPIDQRFNPDGKAEDVAVDYNTGLRNLELAFGGPVGNSVVSIEYDFTDYDMTFMRGVTDSLTFGVYIPVTTQKTRVKVSIDPSAPLQLEDVQNFLGGGLDINGDGTPDTPRLGYKRVENWSRTGISDIEGGVRYQYVKTDDWRLAFTGAVRFPTGKVDDPDNLVDVEFGTGAYALLFRFNQDYTGINKLTLNGTLKYDVVLPDKQTKRVPVDVNDILTSNKEKVKRDLGDIFELEASGNYSISKVFSFNIIYNYKFNLKDQISGTQGFAYESLEEETNRTSHIIIGGFSYTTLPLFMEKKFPLPLTASISYRDRFAGSNNVLKAQYVDLGVQFFF